MQNYTSENTHRWGEDHCTAVLQFNKTGLDQQRKVVVSVCNEAAESKLENWRPAVQWHFPQQWVFAVHSLCSPRLGRYVVRCTLRPDLSQVCFATWERLEKSNIFWSWMRNFFRLKLLMKFRFKKLFDFSKVSRDSFLVFGQSFRFEVGELCLSKSHQTPVQGSYRLRTLNCLPNYNLSLPVASYCHCPVSINHKVFVTSMDDNEL